MAYAARWRSATYLNPSKFGLAVEKLMFAGPRDVEQEQGKHDPAAQQVRRQYGFVEIALAQDSPWQPANLANGANAGQFDIAEYQYSVRLRHHSAAWWRGWPPVRQFKLSNDSKFVEPAIEPDASAARQFLLVSASFFGIVLGLSGIAKLWRVAHAMWGLPAAVGKTLVATAFLAWVVIASLTP